MARPRNHMLWAVLGVALLGCGTVDPGPQFQVAEVVFDQNFYYCKVEPMLLTQRCGSGDPAKGDSTCHGSVTTFRFTDTDAQGAPLQPTDCGGGIVPVGPVASQSRDNWGAASLKMKTDPEQAPLLLKPTNRAPHPREIFSDKSAQANLIRQWATQYASR